jgi:glycosyltransferase involved in cell wall biosynthesis
MAKLFYDYQAFTNLKYGGISRYLYEVATRISREKDISVRVAAGFYVNKYLEECPRGMVLGCQVPLIPKTSVIKSYANEKFCQGMLHMHKPDIVHETYYSPKRLAPVNSRIVLTVYDMIHEKFVRSLPDFMSKGVQDFIQSKLIAVGRADHIVCISQKTKEDLVEFTGVSPDKVSVVYLGHSIQSNSVASEQCLPEPYILYVGERRPQYKNVRRLVQAYASSTQLRKNFKLVFFGPQKFSKSESDLFSELGLDGMDVIQISGNDDVLRSLYTYASAFVYPSLYEGFGIPPLEAMGFGCPVVCSSEGSIPEIVGEAGAYFNPYDISDISDALERVVLSSSYSQNLVKLGLERVDIFSWTKCAREMQSIYRRIAS